MLSCYKYHIIKVSNVTQVLSNEGVRKKYYKQFKIEKYIVFHLSVLILLFLSSRIMFNVQIAQ